MFFSMVLPTIDPANLFRQRTVFNGISHGTRWLCISLGDACGWSRPGSGGTLCCHDIQEPTDGESSTRRPAKNSRYQGQPQSPHRPHCITARFFSKDKQRQSLANTNRARLFLPSVAVTPYSGFYHFTSSGNDLPVFSCLRQLALGM